MKRNTILELILLLMLFCWSCEKEKSAGPIILSTINDQAVSEITVSKNSAVTVKFDVIASNDIAKVEIYSRNRRGIPLKIDSYEKILNQVEGKLFNKSYVVNALNDVSYSIYVIDVDGNYESGQVDLLMDISEFDDKILYDAKLDGSSLTFFNTKYGLPLSVSYTTSDPASIDFGFIYMESNVNVKASLVSFSDFGKTATYPIVGTNNLTIFKRVQTFSYTDLASLKLAFDTGSDFSSVLGIEIGKIAMNLKDGDVISFKTEQGKYGLILVKTIDRKGEANKNEQTIKLKMVVQK